MSLLRFLLLFFVFCNITLCCSQQQLPQEDGLCSKVDCGQGTCVPTDNPFLVDCECFPGWTKFQLGPFFSYCGLPNCTVNFDCGPPPLPTLPSANDTDPCNFVWCADGTCAPDGIGHKCQCADGSSNLLGLPALPCFKPCYLGADCTNVNLGAGAPPSTKSAAAPPNGPSDATNSARKLQALTTLALSAILLTWI